jgi:hypothetical protein
MSDFSDSPLPAGDSRRRARLMAVAVMFAVAGAGVVGGISIDRWMIKEGVVQVRGPRDSRGGPGDRSRRGGGGGRPPGPPGMDRGGPFGGPGERQRFTDFLTRELDLTTEQRVRVDSIVGRQVTEIHAIWEQMRPRMDSVVGGARGEIERVLTPEQRTKFAELRERRRGPRGEGRGGGDDRGDRDRGGRGPH